MAMVSSAAARRRLPAGVLAAALFLLVAALLAPPAIAAGLNRDKLRGFVDEALSLVDEYYVRQVEFPQLTLNALQGLASLDPRLAVTRRGQSVHVHMGDTVAGSFYVQGLKTEQQWADLATAIVALAYSVSPPIRQATEEELFKSLADHMLSGLDRFSRYADAGQASDNRANRDGFGGVGIRVDVEGGVVRISEVLPGTPASRARLKDGDRILTIDDQPTRGMSHRAVISRLRGDPHSQVQLGIERPADPQSGDREGRTSGFAVTLEREHIFIQTVFARREEAVLILKVEGFNNHTRDAMLDAIKEARRDGQPLAGIVVDMRDNPGGVLKQAVEVADLFLHDGLILSQWGRHKGSRETHEASASREDELTRGLALVVAVNGGSASAAEVVAAALQESGRAVVVGSASYGKGTVQRVLDTVNKGEFNLTWAKLLGPSGYTFHDVGVIPNVCTIAPGRGIAELVRQSGAEAPELRQARFQLAREFVDTAEAKKVREFCTAPTAEARAGSGAGSRAAPPPQAVALSGDVRSDRDLRAALDLIANRPLYERALTFARPVAGLVARAPAGTPAPGGN